MPDPRLEDRFTAPAGWRWHYLKRNGYRLRFGSVFPKDSIPDGIVVCLPGLSEFGEKYFEVARDCLAKNLAFWVLDWRGQGLSDRYLKNPHKRHSKGFSHDVEDLHDFILGYVKHSSVHPDKGRIPMVMLAHSMGANIGLHYLHAYPDMFECAAFTAPMFGVHALRVLPDSLALPMTGILNALGGTAYVPGGSDWSGAFRITKSKDLFSSDIKRAAVHNAWCEADPRLQVGSPTLGWLYHACKSCRNLRKIRFVKSIQTPSLIALAGEDTLVDNDIACFVAREMPHAELLQFHDAKHEILMEHDIIRRPFMDAFFKLIEETIISRPETLKPF
ncbi:MAG: alpha/beta fold hydrolase [Bdellovibrionales bacterium]